MRSAHRGPTTFEGRREVPHAPGSVSGVIQNGE